MAVNDNEKHCDGTYRFFHSQGTSSKGIQWTRIAAAVHGLAMVDRTEIRNKQCQHSNVSGIDAPVPTPRYLNRLPDAWRCMHRMENMDYYR